MNELDKLMEYENFKISHDDHDDLLRITGRSFGIYFMSGIVKISRDLNLGFYITADTNYTITIILYYAK